MKKIKEIFKKTKVPFIMCIITFVIGCLLFKLYITTGSIDNLTVFFVLFAPFFVFLFLVLLHYKFYDNLRIMNIFDVINVILIISVFLYYFTAIFGLAFESSLNPLTDIKKYSNVVESYSLESVFPKNVPSNVSDTKFMYSPGILQGGTIIYLYYVDESMDLNKFNKKYEDKAIGIGNIEDLNDENDFISGAFSYTPAEDNNENDYIIYLFEGSCDDSGYCNHGDFLFAAFNEKTKEVIYKLEDW